MAIPLALIIALVSAMTFYIEGVEQDAMRAVRNFPDIILQQQVGGRTESLLFDRYEPVLRENLEIKAVYPRIWGHINFSDRGNHNKAFVVMGFDPQYIESGLLIEAAIENGRALQASDAGSGVIGKALAAALNCTVGDVVEISSPGRRQKNFIEIVGIFSSPVQIYTADLLLVDIETARKIFGYYSLSEFSDVLVYLKNPAMGERVAEEIATAIDGARPLTRSVMQSLTEQSFGQKSGLFQMFWLILLINILIIAWSLMGQISLNLRREVGILKAIGWDTADVMLLKFMETTLISFGAVLAGLAGGLGYMLLDAPGLKRFIIGWADIYPDFPIPLYIDPQSVLLIVVVGILPLLCATLIPVWRLGIIDPDEAIRA